MNRRSLLGGFLGILCLGALSVMWLQHRQLGELRAEQTHLLEQSASKASPASNETEGPIGAAAPEAAPTATPELLRLRSEVTRLGERRRELAGVQSENESLRAQLASRGTNGAASLALPSGYIRKSQARLVGYATPADTLQSLLWAIQNRDLTNVMQAFTSERAESFLAEIKASNRSPDDFFRDTTGLPGMGVVGQSVEKDNERIRLEVEVVPGMPRTQIPFRQQNGQWKISGPF